MSAARLRIISCLTFVALAWLPGGALGQGDADVANIKECILTKKSLETDIKNASLGIEIRVGSPKNGTEAEALKPKKIKAVQHLLRDIYRASNSIKNLDRDQLDDGVIGAKTLVWAGQFCRDFLSDSKAREHDNLTKAFEHYHAIRGSRFGWSRLLELDHSHDDGSDDQQSELRLSDRDVILHDDLFLFWVNEPWMDAKAVDKTWTDYYPENPDSAGRLTVQPKDLLRYLRRLGTDAVVEALLREFRADDRGIRNEILNGNRDPGPRTYYKLGEALDGLAWKEHADAAAPTAGKADACKTSGLSKEDVESRLQLIKNTVYPDHRLFLDALVAALNCYEQPSTWEKAAGDRIAFLPLVEEAKRSIEEAPSLYPPVTIDTEGCGCAPEFNSVTYGILTPWLANDISGEKKTEAPPRYPVDFGILNRIGFPDLVLSPSVGRDYYQRWDERFDAGGFIAKAHRYNTKVDLMVRVQDLLGWDTDGMKTIDDAVSQVVDRLKLERPIRERAAGWQAWLWDLAFGDWHYGTELDGVTILFEDLVYDRKQGRTTLAEKGEAAVQFLKKLLPELEGRYRLNIALNSRSQDVETVLASIEPILKISNQKKDEERWAPFLELLPRYESTIDPRIDLILLFLPEPTTDTKKLLRAELDWSDVFRGDDRLEVLRRIVPVIPSDGHKRPVRIRDQQRLAAFEGNPAYAQLKDDLIYFRDNYRGIGFWPLPMQTGAEPNPVEALVLDQFTQEVSNGTLTQILIAFNSLSFCDYVCPNRIQFSWALVVVFGIFAAPYLLTYASCAFREWVASHTVMFVILPLLATAIIAGLLLACDPAWRSMEAWVVIGFLLSGVYVLSRWLIRAFLRWFFDTRGAEVP